MGFPKISRLFVLCAVCNRRRSYLPRVVDLGVVRSSVRHQERLCVSSLRSPELNAEYDEKTLVSLVPIPKLVLIIRATTEMVECASRMVEDGGEGVCGLDVNQNLSQPPKCNQLMPHEAPELAKLQVALYVGVR